MEILGIGASELVFVIIIALLVLGPKDMQKAGKTIGKWLRNIITSDGWRVFQQTSREIRNLPTRLMREANEDLEKINRDINREVNKTPAINDLLTLDRKTPSRKLGIPLGQSASSSSPNPPPSNEIENTIQPPPVNSPEPSNPSAATDDAERTPNNHV